MNEKKTANWVEREIDPGLILLPGEFACVRNSDKRESMW
jgi:hypothetical protein